MNRTRKKVGFIGLGAIGRSVMTALRKEGGYAPEIVGVLGSVQRGAPAAVFAGKRFPFVANAQDLLSLGPDLLVEVASQKAIHEHGEAILEAGKDLMVISTGAFADQRLSDRLTAAARASGAQILLPAGALGGIDVLASARLGGLTAVRQEIAKPPLAWKGTPAEAVLDLNNISECTAFFEGSAREAATRYPQNANVAATVALAGLGFERSQVSLVADPALRGPRHSLEIEGAFGSFRMELRGIALPENPKSSVLAALAITRALLNSSACIVI